MATPRIVAKPKPCTQEGFCADWADCPYLHDMAKCLGAAMDDLPFTDNE
jgi:hypothetical protein